MGCNSNIRVKHRFQVFSDDTPQGGSEGIIELGSFKKVDGIELETEVISWKTGDMNAETKLPGFTKSPAITLEKGFDDEEKLKDWYDLVFSLNNGAGAMMYCKDLIIKVLNRDGSLFKQIRAKNAWPSKYAADELDGQSSAPWVETAEMQHDGWDYEEVT